MKQEIETKFYTYWQNNSGGYILTDKNDGIADYVIVEARNMEEANNRMDSITCGYTDYCECCGERWDDYPAEEEKPTAMNLRKTIYQDMET